MCHPVLVNYAQGVNCMCSRQEIYQFLESERKHPDHRSANMFVMFILSHGEDGHFYALNGVKISIDRVISYFDGNSCEALLGKPKLFFIQACQGGRFSSLHSL